MKRKDKTSYAGGMMTLTGVLLLVDDDAASRTALRQQLEGEGHEVVECGSGQEAIAILDGGSSVELVLLDVGLPLMSGYEVCYHLRQRFGPQQLPIVFLSGRQDTTDVVTAFECGANDYVIKPCEPRELLARVNVQLSLSVAQRALEQRNQQLKLAQQHLAQNEKMAALGLLSAGVAHEINNPNNFLRMSAQNLRIKLDEFHNFLFSLVDEGEAEVREEFDKRFDRLGEDLSLILDGSHRINEIVAGMRNATRGDTGGDELFDPVSGLEATLMLVKPSYKTSVGFEARLDARAHVSGRSSQLNQVFTNLLVNACHAIEARLGPGDEAGHVVLDSAMDTGQLVIVIRDDGCGMSDDVRARIFEPFFTTKNGDTGTGLGMSICKNIIEEHGGRIEVASIPGKGTTVTIRLPVAS